MNNLESLKKYTVAVADTGDFESIKEYSPTDATTNPSLIYKAACIEEYDHLVKDAIKYGKTNGKNEKEILELVLDKTAVNFGCEILKIVPGVVSTEVDARLSFDTEGSLKRVKRLVKMYEEMNVKKERVLFKLAATWEGIKAAEILEREGIRTNLTLLFSFAQAVACAEAKVYLISPFVGRILDWYKANTDKKEYESHEDPGVVSVKRIYNYYKKHDYKTVVMGASFRNSGEIKELAGCDLLTISPGLLEELQNTDGELPEMISAAKAKNECNEEKISMDEAKFRWMLNEDAMATEKLSEGIRNFTKDLIKLENLIKEKLV